MTRARLQRIPAFLLEDPRALAPITALYLLIGFAFLHYDYTLNDEGLATHYWATWGRLELPAVFFLQKAKPILVVLYLLPSSAGVLATMTAHLLVSALGLPLIAAFARSLGHRAPNFAALVVASSPIFLPGGSSGITNNDAVVGAALVLFLLARRRSLAAGLVLGCLPWVRTEMALLVPILFLHAILVEPNRRFALGTALFPAAYWLAGAAYHRDLLWLVHYPPASPFNPGNPMWIGLPIGPSFFLGFIAAVTPIAFLAACLPFGRLRPIERTLLVYLAVAVVVLEVFPIFKIGNFGGSPRYLTQLLPVLAVVASRAVDVWWEGGAPSLRSSAVALVLTAWSVTRIPALVHQAPLIVAFAALLVLALLGSGRAATLGAACLALSGPLLVPGSRLARDQTAAYLDPMEGWLATHRDAIQGPVYTNSQMLEAFAELRGRLPALDVRFLIAFDHLEGTVGLGNPDNGQREAIGRLSAQSFYGHGVVASALRPDDIPPGTLFALRVERRLERTLPPQIWSARLEILYEEGGARIARLRSPAAPAAR